ncbi:MAG: HlyD family type I secretion periplasmic adaptor subunit, partial [Pseudomonadota bacterium]
MAIIEGTAVRILDPIPVVPTDDLPYRRLGVVVLVLAFGLGGVWSAFAPLHSATAASGQIKVEARRQTIQHLEGGIVKEIAVAENDVVQAGQLLIRLSDVQSGAQLNIVGQQHAQLLAEEARLIAERDKKPAITFPAGLLTQANKDPEIAQFTEGQRREFEVRREARAHEDESLRQRIGQLREQIRGLEALTSSDHERIQSLRAEVKDWEGLYQKQLIDKTRLLDYKRTLLSMEGDRAARLTDIARIKVQIGETESQILFKQQSFLSDVVARLRDVQSRRVDYATRITALKDTLQRTEIRSPVYGAVVNLDVHTVGAVIPAGKAILEIVPLSDDIVIEAAIQVSDIDQIIPGLTADLRFPAFKSRFTYVIEGRVRKVSADAIVDPSGRFSYYKTEVDITPAGWVEIKRNGFKLIP